MGSEKQQNTETTAHTAKVVARITIKKYKECEDVLGVRFTGGKGTGDTIETLRLKPKRTLSTDKGCACFIDGELVSDRLNWTKMLHILKNTILSCAKKRSTTNLHRTECSVATGPKGDK